MHSFEKSTTTCRIESLTDFAGEKQFLALVIAGENRLETSGIGFVTTDDEFLSLVDYCDDSKKLTLKGLDFGGWTGEEIWDTLVEMLDEPQQLRNFTARLENGSEVPDPSAARLAVIGALKAVQSFHQKKPQTDLGRLTDAIARVVQSENAPVRVEAEKTKLALFGK